MLKKITDMDFYVLSEDLSNKFWGIVKKWNWFGRETVGKQLVGAADSISEFQIRNINSRRDEYWYKYEWR